MWDDSPNGVLGVGVVGDGKRRLVDGRGVCNLSVAAKETFVLGCGFLFVWRVWQQRCNKG